MAWLNDSMPGPSSSSWKGKEPACDKHWWSSILIDGDDPNDHDQHQVTYEDFLWYIHEKPEWLYEKLQSIHQQFKEVIDDCEAQLVESELLSCKQISPVSSHPVPILCSWLSEWNVQFSTHL